MNEAKTLYVRRDVLNAKDILEFYKEQGFGATVPPDKLHVTIAYSKAPVAWEDVGQDLFQRQDGTVKVWPTNVASMRSMAKLGAGEAVVLKFLSAELLARHNEIRNCGASWDWPTYQSHITISYDAPYIDVSTIKPWAGEIILGSEVFEELDENWSDKVEESSYKYGE